MSACSESQSTIFPLPSSPHWEPTTTTLAMSCPSAVWPEMIATQQWITQAPALPELSEATAAGKAAWGPSTTRRQPKSSSRPSPQLGGPTRPDESAHYKAFPGRYLGDNPRCPQLFGVCVGNPTHQRSRGGNELPHLYRREE